MDVHTELEPDRTYSSREACALAGVTYRQIDYWIHKGLIRGMESGVGSGQPRRWSVEQITELRTIVAKLNEAHRILEELGFHVPRRKTPVAA